MIKSHLLPFKWNSFFVKLMTAFLGMIVLLLSFNFLSFTFFKNNIHEDIIKYNSLELSKTVDGYEKHFDLLKRDLINVLLSQPVTSLMNHDDAYDYLTVLPAMTEMQNLLSNQLLNLDNLIIYSPNRTYTVEGNVTNTTSNLFVTRLASTRYPLSFWQQQIKERYGFRIFPSAPFQSQTAVGSNFYPEGNFFPIIVKNYAAPSAIMVALVNADSLYERFQVNNKNSFYILDEDGNLLFGSKPDHAIQANLLPGGSNHTIIGDKYYFYNRGESSRFTYVEAVPIANVNSSISRLTLILAAILVVSLLLGLIVSFILSIRFNSPIRRMIAGMQNARTPAGPLTGINELDWISQTVSLMVQTNEAIHSDLDKKNMQLKHYGYLNQIKRVHQSKEPVEPGSPFYLVLFTIAYRDQFELLPAVEQVKASYYITEYINLTLSETFKETVTLQIEQNQIASLLFTNEPAAAVLSVLNQLKQVFDRDKDYFLLTIVFQPVQRDSSELAEHYEAAARILNQRKLTDSTQIITEFTPMEEFTPMPLHQEQELDAALQAGESDRPIEQVSLCLNQLSRRGASASQLYAFAKETVAKVLKAMVACNLEIGSFVERHNPYGKIPQCVSLEDLIGLLSEMIRDGAREIQELKAQQDPIKDFVLNYIRSNYNQDISLESAARKLNMSRNYLSTYFREKTGITFTDYLNTFRIMRAKELLGSKDIQIQEVAGQIGYLNTNSFIRMFKKISGMTPGEYRRSILLGDENTS